MFPAEVCSFDEVFKRLESLEKRLNSLKVAP
jgi:hypothetical protein